MNPNSLLFSQREKERESRRSPVLRGLSGGAMVLGKRLVPGRHTNSDNSRARAYCACSRRGWGLFGQFLSRLQSRSETYVLLFRRRRRRRRRKLFCV